LSQAFKIIKDDVQDGKQKQDKLNINIARCSYIEGDVNTGGGDFIGRDKKVDSGELNG
jgi:hypothetical protein